MSLILCSAFNLSILEKKLLYIFVYRKIVYHGLQTDKYNIDK